jgi:hypothetical protein
MKESKSNQRPLSTFDCLMRMPVDGLGKEVDRFLKIPELSSSSQNMTRERRESRSSTASYFLRLK